MFLVLIVGAAIALLSWWAIIENRVGMIGSAGVALGLTCFSAAFSNMAAGVPILHPYWGFAAICLVGLMVFAAVRDDFKNAGRSSRIFSATLFTIFGTSSAIAAGIHTGPIANIVGASGMVVVLGMVLSAEAAKRVRKKKA